MLERVVAFIAGTRPEAIKIGPLVVEFKKSTMFNPVVINTEQHGNAVAEILEYFGIGNTFSLDVKRHSGSLGELTSLLSSKLENTLSEIKPDLVIVQGDTLSAFVGTYISVLLHLPVAHLEAGLRSFDNNNPFPEEFHRKAIAQLATIHFPPTLAASTNLVNEGIKHSTISVVGNSVVDAMALLATGRIGTGEKSRTSILVTMHRRENWGEPIFAVANELKNFAEAHTEFEIRWVLHSNPALAISVSEILQDIENIILLDPLPYKMMLEELMSTDIVLTDSGGIQEEAPSFKKPVIVLRKQTERQEGIHFGIAKLVDPMEFVPSMIIDFLKNNPFSNESEITAQNPYGDGLCAVRCRTAIESFLLHGDADWKINDINSDGFKN